MAPLTAPALAHPPRAASGLTTPGPETSSLASGPGPSGARRTAEPGTPAGGDHDCAASDHGEAQTPATPSGATMCHQAIRVVEDLMVDIYDNQERFARRVRQMDREQLIAALIIASAGLATVAETHTEDQLWDWTYASPARDRSPNRTYRNEPLKPHGTYGAAKRHRRAGERPCEPCRAAEAEHARKYRRAAA